MLLKPTYPGTYCTIDKRVWLLTEQLLVQLLIKQLLVQAQPDVLVAPPFTEIMHIVHMYVSTSIS